MKSSFFNSIKNLLPKSVAFDITHDTNLRRLVEAIAVLPEELRTEMENVYMDLFPDSTRSPERWEEVFAVVFTSDELEQRRNILSVLWSMNQTGQSVSALEQILQAVYPDIAVEENVPVSNPRRANVAYLNVCGNKNMVCGNKVARCSYRVGNESFVPSVLWNDTAEGYSIPNDERYWQLCFFVCKGVRRNAQGEILYAEPIQVPRIYKNYIEYLILRIKPVQSIAILAMEWTD